MSEQEIIEGNKLIAEFMGGENHPFLIPYIPEPDDIWFSVENHPEERHPDNGSMWKLNELKYHSSWDWLMPVVEKIESLNIRNNGYDFPKVKFLGDCVEIFTYATYRGTTFYWKGYMGLDGKCYNHLSNQKNSKIEAVWYAVVEFIKWYNQWKKEK